MTIEAKQSGNVGYAWLLWVVAALVFVADQWSKTRIIEALEIGESWRPWAGTPLLELFAFTHTKNSGAAFGMFQTGGWFFIIVAIVVSAGIVWYLPRLPREQWWLFLSLGLQLGGALGNLVDRLRIGHVTDFVHIGSFAIFNVADSAIFCGVLILAWHLWREDKVKKAEEEAEEARLAAVAAEPTEWLETTGELWPEESSGMSVEEPLAHWPNGNGAKRGIPDG